MPEKQSTPRPSSGAREKQQLREHLTAAKRSHRGLGIAIQKIEALLEKDPREAEAEEPSAEG